MYTEITTTELRSRLDAGEPVILLDVRQPEEHEEKNIPNSILIPLEPMRGKEIVVYCRSGNRSAQACLFLAANGYDDLKNLKGGMLAW